jgi:hypothetical protein
MVACVLGMLALFGPGRAAADQTEECISSHVGAQRMQRERKLRDARDALRVCSRDACPRVVVQECTALLREVENALPSVVIDARTASGQDVVDVRVSMDGGVLLERLDGKAVDIDPGEHRFRFERADSKPTEQSVLIREGERGRRISVRFEDGPAGGRVEPERASRPIPPLAIGLGGLGLAGVSLFAVMGIMGISQKRDLDNRACKPTCPSDDVDAARRSFLVADIGLGVGVAALAAATVLFVTRPTVQRPAAQRGLRLSGASVVMRPDGGALVLRGSH